MPKAKGKSKEKWVPPWAKKAEEEKEKKAKAKAKAKKK